MGIQKGVKKKKKEEELWAKEIKGAGHAQDLPQTIYLTYARKTSEFNYNIFVFSCDLHSILMV